MSKKNVFYDNINEDDFARKYAGLVFSIARKYFIKAGDGDDLAQEGMIGLIMAVRTFNPERMGNFDAYAALCIKRRVIDAVRKSAAKDGRLDITYLDFDNQEFYGDDGDNNPEIQFLANESAKEIVDTLINSLSTFESSVAKLFLEGLSAGEIAGALSKSKKTVDNAIVRIKIKAEKSLTNRRTQERS